MALTPEEIRERLRVMAGSYAPAVSNIAQVKSVDEAECTCVLVDDDGLEFFDVRLRPVTGKNKSFLQIPKEGSFVLAVRVEDTDEWMVVACDEVEKVQILIGEESIYSLISDLFTAIMKMTFSNSAGTTGTTLNISEFQALKKRFEKIMM